MKLSVKPFIIYATLGAVLAFSPYVHAMLEVESVSTEEHPESKKPGNFTTLLATLEALNQWKEEMPSALGEWKALQSEEELGEWLKTDTQSTKRILIAQDWVTDTALNTLLQATPDLIELRLVGCDQFTDQALEVIGKNCPNLKWLTLNHCQGLVDISPLGEFKNLTGLRLSECKNIDISKLEYLPKSITELYLSGIPKIPVVFFLHDFTSLAHLELVGCCGSVKESLPFLPTSLTSLKLSGFIDGLSTMALRRFTKLTNLDLFDGYNAGLLPIPLTDLDYQFNWDNFLDNRPIKLTIKSH